MKKFSLIIFLATVLISGLILGACAKPAPAPAPAPAPQPVLKIGALAFLGTPEGVEIQKWMNLLAKQYNEAGGWKIGGVSYKVEPVVYDCGPHDVAKTRTAVERAVLQDGVKYIVANWFDIPSEVITVTEPNKVLYMALDFTDTTVQPDLNYTVRSLGLYLSRYLAYKIEKDMMAKGAKTVVIVDPDTEQGKAGDFLFSASNKLVGIDVVGIVNYPMTTVDFGPIATKIVSYNPDYVELAMVAGDPITGIISALKDVGYKGLVLPGTALNPVILANTVKRVGAEYMEGWEDTLFDPVGITKDPKMLALIDAYIKEYGSWRSEGCFYMGSWFLFEDAVNSTQSTDVDVLVKYLQNSKHGVATLEGYSQLFARPDLNNYKTIDCAPGHYLGVIKDGKFSPLGTIAVKDQYLCSIKVYGLVDVYKKYWEEYGYPTFPDQPADLDYSFLD